MKRLIALILTISLPISSFAECTKPVIQLNEGASAPCKGFLFTPEKELEVRIMTKEFELLELETKNLNLIIDKQKKKEVEFNKVIDLEQQKTELWKHRAEDITFKYVQVEEKRSTRDFWMVVLGVALTVGAGYAIGAAANGQH